MNPKDTQTLPSARGKTEVKEDWEQVHERIATFSATGIDATSPEVLEQIWARRAAQLAKPVIEEEIGEQIELVIIQLGQEIYGIDVRYVFDIRPLPQFTPVPRVPEWVTGVVNLRGHILSILDLRRLFGLPPQKQDDSKTVSTLVVVRTPEMELALLTDGVVAVESIPANRIQEPEATIPGLRPEYVRGITKRRGLEAGPTLVVLDLPALLGDPRLIIHEEII